MPEVDNHDTNSGESVEEIVQSEIATDLLGGIPLPAPIRRNLFKAFSRLCSAAIELPIAHLEGKAEERRAETEARVSLVKVTASQISEQMRVDPEYARRAATQFGNKILREQANLDMITAQAMEHLKLGRTSHGSGSDEKEIDDDWLHNFDTEARKRSTEEMQEFFARILCGEIERPNSFSIKAVKVLGDMDKKSAEDFTKICSMSVSLSEMDGQIIDARVLSLGGNAASNALAKYGLNFGQLNYLSEHGLIISDYHSWRDYQPCIGQSVQTPEGSQMLLQVPFSYQGKSWLLTPTIDRQRSSDFKLHGVSFTGVGLELKKIIDPVSVESYTDDLIAFFGTKHFKMTEVQNGPRLTSMEVS